jgi:protein-tyrosine-phosphatase/predicted ATP-grasp superfamily ATP-dependent carboligase
VTRLHHILVIGDDTRSFLSVVRSLGRVGYIVDVVMHQPGADAGYSKYIRHSHKLPPVALHPTKWMAAISELQSKYQYNLIVPCDDSGLVPIMTLTNELDHSIIATPGQKAFDIFYDKYVTLNAAMELGIPIASHHSVSRAALDTVRYPIALKPKRSFNLLNLAQKQTVTILYSMDEAIGAIEEIKKTDYFLENYFEGIGVGISVIAKNGRILSAFQHERMEEGVSGGSSLRKSVPLHPDMLKDTEKLAKHAQLEGVAMFEFRYNQASDSFVLLEVNARFWGSLPLAVYAGTDFPVLLASSRCTADTITATQYRTGKVSRSLTASFYSFVRSIGKATSIKQKTLLCFNIITGVVRTLLFQEKVDTFAFDDWKPFSKEISAIFSILYKGFSRRLSLAPIIRKRRIKRKLSHLNATRQPVRKILFLCYGNICRSPYAELVLKRLLPSQKYNINSAGFHMVENRRSPQQAITAAQNADIDLTKHKSSFASQPLIESADIIILFDERNEIDLARYYCAAKDRALNLGDFLPLAQDIEDPFNKGADIFTQCYREIELALELFVENLGRE